MQLFYRNILSMTELCCWYQNKIFWKSSLFYNNHLFTSCVFPSLIICCLYALANLSSTFFFCVLRKIRNTGQCIVMKSCFTLFGRRYFLFYVLRCNNRTLSVDPVRTQHQDPTAIYHAVKLAKSVAGPRSILNRAINFRKTLEEARFSRKKHLPAAKSIYFPPSFLFNSITFWLFFDVKKDRQMSLPFVLYR